MRPGRGVARLGGSCDRFLGRIYLGSGLFSCCYRSWRTAAICADAKKVVMSQDVSPPSRENVNSLRRGVAVLFWACNGQLSRNFQMIVPRSQGTSTVLQEIEVTGAKFFCPMKVNKTQALKKHHDGIHSKFLFAAGSDQAWEVVRGRAIK